jgi:hypothetical protein
LDDFFPINCYMFHALSTAQSVTPPARLKIFISDFFSPPPLCHGSPL